MPEIFITEEPALKVPPLEIFSRTVIAEAPLKERTLPVPTVKFETVRAFTVSSSDAVPEKVIPSAVKGLFTVRIPSILKSFVALTELEEEAEPIFKL